MWLIPDTPIPPDRGVPLPAPLLSFDLNAPIDVPAFLFGLVLPIFDQRAATIVLLLLAVLSVLAFALAVGVAIM